MLKVTNIEIVYNDVILAVRGISLEVPQGGIVALLGSNGAGKSTTLKAISGVLDNEEGEIVDGKIEFKDIPDGVCSNHTSPSLVVFNIIPSQPAAQPTLLFTKCTELST